jgi:exodeoxyribonuclease V alpha subunit
MVDIFLFRTLLTRISKGTRLVMVGDKDQLPSVGAGNVLADLIASGVVPAVSLTHIYRQSLQSLIVTNAHAINKGEMPNLSVKDKDFFFMRSTTPDEIATLTTSVSSERIPKYLGVTPDKVQVLCPLKLGSAGVINLNRQLQNKLNPRRIDKIETEDYEFAVGDKVMHTQNNYELEWKIVQGYKVVEGKGVFNGDIGTVTDVDKTARTLVVTFEDGRRATYGGEDISELTLAYAITVHKSQGSEFDAVIMPIVSGSPMIMTRNLLYTAITRAKKTVVLIGEEYNIKKMVNNDYVAKRYSALVKFIDEAVDKRKILYGDKKPTTYEQKFDNAFGLNIQNNNETLET